MYQQHSETSREAYHTKGGRGTVRETVRKAIEDAGERGMTAGWIAKNLGMQTGSVAARLIELEREAKIIKLKQTRKNPSGKNGNIYVVVAWRHMFALDQILPPKKADKKQNLDSSAREVLEQVESYIAMGSPIHSGSVLHNRIKDLISHV